MPPSQPRSHGTRIRRVCARLALLALGCSLIPESLLAAPEKLEPLHQRLELAGVPVEILNLDLDRDAVRDLAVVIASTTWGETAFEEETRLDEGTLVDVLTVVPTLFDRREILWFRGRGEGGFEDRPRALELPATVHGVAAGPSGAPLVAWTDEGISEIVLRAALDLAPGESPSVAPEPVAGEPLAELELVPRVRATSLLSGSRSFIPKIGLTRDIDGDGEVDLLLPVERGLEVYRGSADGIATAPGVLLETPADFLLPARPRERSRRERQDEDEPEVRPVEARVPGRDVYLPELVDLDGDRRLDLLYRDPPSGGSGRRGRLSLGGMAFGAPFDPLGDSELEDGLEVVWVGELDGTAGAELVTSEEIQNEKDSMRAELAEAKRPRARLRVHRLNRRGLWDPKSVSTFEVEGYVLEGGESDGTDGDGIGFELPAGVRDLDGDGRLDLIAIRLDFSLFEAMRILTTHSIRIGLDFAIYRQGDGLSFREVQGLDLSGELRLRLDDVSLGQIASFSGDFDGDGRYDFAQLGRGRKVTIHRGQEGARYAPKADLTMALDREPADVALVQVADFDGDGRSDLAVTQPVDSHQIGARAALELHLSRRAP